MTSRMWPEDNFEGLYILGVCIEFGRIFPTAIGFNRPMCTLLTDFQNLCDKLAKICIVTSRLNEQLAQDNTERSELLANHETQHIYGENTSSNKNVPPDINENLSANELAGDTADDDESANQNARTSSILKKSKQATVEVDPHENNDREMVNAWIDESSNAMVQSMGYILFALLVILCAVSLAGTLALGVTLSPREAWSWVRIFCLGLIIHFFILETFKVLLVACFFATFQRKLIM